MPITAHMITQSQGRLQLGAFNALASYRFATDRSAVIPMSEIPFKRMALSDAQVSDRDAFLEDKI